ncbi:hypothetical protein ACFL4T_11245 [candidate division KSB1 bacterium]
MGSNQGTISALDRKDGRDRTEFNTNLHTSFSPLL